MQTLPQPREMLSAFERRDASYDGVFFTAVRTTGIFCRPTCPARRPKAENVEFFSTVREAVFAGYRPCKRCRPLETAGAAPEWVRTLLACIENKPTERLRDADIRALGVEPARARRYFMEHYGMTFHAYARGRRLANAFHELKQGAELDDVALEHGFESLSGFRDAFTRAFGDAPARSRGTDCIVATWIESPLGALVAAASDDGVCLLEFSDRRMLETQFETIRTRFGRPLVPGTHRYLDQLRDELAQYLAGTRREFSVPLTFPGTDFQRRVWDALLTIPYGETWSYEQLARVVGSPGASRAVGHANGQNRVAIVIPCHRVVNKDGKLGGYGGGLWRKQRLLELEARHSGLFFKGSELLRNDDVQRPNDETRKAAKP